MIQGFVEVPSQQTNVLGFIELARADYGSRNRMGCNEVADRGPDEAVVGRNPAVMAIEELIDRLPGVVDAASKISRCHAGPSQVVLQLQPDFGRFRQARRQQLPAYRVGESHGYSSVSSRTISSMNSGLALVCKSCGRSRVAGDGGDCSCLGISARCCR